MRSHLTAALFGAFALLLISAPAEAAPLKLNQLLDMGRWLDCQDAPPEEGCGPEARIWEKNGVPP